MPISQNKATIGAVFLGRCFAKLEDLRIVHVGDQVLRLFAELVNLFGLTRVLRSGCSRTVGRYTCRKPHFHMHSHCTVQITCFLWLKSRIVRPEYVIHPRVMFHLAPHCILNTSTSSLSPASLVLLSSSTPNPGLLSPIPLFHGRSSVPWNIFPPQGMIPTGLSSTGFWSTTKSQN